MRRSCLLFIILYVFLVALPQWLGNYQLIGNPDRLVAHLDVQIAEIEAIRKGDVPSMWNERTFMGQSIAAPQLVPIIDPIPWILAYSGTRQPIFWITCWALFQFALIGVTSFGFFQKLIDHELSSLLGSITYMSSYHVVLHSFSIDHAALNFIALPLGLGALKQLSKAVSGGQTLLLMLSILLSCMSFLQSTSYVLLTLGFYCIFLTVRNGLGGRLLFIFGFASLSAILVAAPRIAEVALAYRTYIRAPTNSVLVEPREIFRVVYDGLLGQNHAEASEVGGINSSEGYTAYSSMFVSLVVIFLQPLLASREEIYPILAFIALMAWAVFPDFGLSILLGALILLVLLKLSKITLPNRAKLYLDGDLVFFNWCLVILTAFIIIPPLEELLRRIYMCLDFAHGRMSFIVALAFSVSAATTLKRLYS